MTDTKIARRDFIKETGATALGVALAANFTSASAATPAAAPTTAAASPFNIQTAFADYMRGLGEVPTSAGGQVTFTGQDPIVRSHFRIATCMAIPAMGAGVTAAAIWRDRTGQEQDLKIDLREAMYNVNPLMTIIMQQRMAMGAVPRTLRHRAEGAKRGMSDNADVMTKSRLCASWPPHLILVLVLILD